MIQGGRFKHRRYGYDPVRQCPEKRSGEALSVGESDCLGPPGRADFGVEVGDVALRRAHTDAELVGDLFVALANGEQSEHVGLARRQSGGQIRPSGRGADPGRQRIGAGRARGLRLTQRV